MFPDEDYDDYLYEQEYENAVDQFNVGLDNIKHMEVFEEQGLDANNMDKIMYVVVSSLKEKQNIQITGADIRLIQRGMTHTPNVRFKNMTCFVLGFYITVQEKTIDSKRFKQVTKFLPNLMFVVTAPDVLRYCNLWAKNIWPKMN
jgi:hypothetical protein